MLFSKINFLALLSAIVLAHGVSAGFQAHGGAGYYPSSSALMTDTSTWSSIATSTAVPTVTTSAKSKPTDPKMPDYIPHPSMTVTITSSTEKTSGTVSTNGTSTGYPLMPVPTTNATMTKYVGTGTPHFPQNGTNRTTSPTLTPIPTSLGVAITPYGTVLLVVLVGFVTIGL
ncbi:hypothetical protein L873DRAFT_1792564 [Choiromyces venosus 120613-1]|uniref:Uncharacterized protein n=1 Tax=Choiromyces venosus 120613-1 TaxID=1336337 RepID=A0A3N4JM34_9PEZI|nr:hypothetical protein L873DRAFT_1792564 [Choiromyces venosus 120613-1]